MSAETRRAVEDLSRAVERLREALDEPDTNPLAVDGSIQRFEFTIELFWKVMKHLLAAEGIGVRTPREALEGAYKAGWLTDERTWITLIRARNETSHAYREALARAIRDEVRGAMPEIQRVLTVLKRRAGA